MFIIKLLGILDILTGLFFWIWRFFGVVPGELILIFALYLIIKGLVFLIGADLISVIDIGVGILIYVALNIGLPAILAIVIVLYLVQKGIFSLF